MEIKIIVKGNISNEKPVLFTSNHSSYLDIPILGSIIKGSFVSKKEVASWPVIGPLTKLQNTLFIERRISQSKKQKKAIHDFLNKGSNLIIFPEGTTSDNNRALSFKTSLFSIALEKFKYNGKEQYLKVQPVSVSFYKLNGAITGYEQKALYSWIGDEALFPHLPNFLSLGKKEIIVEFHPVISMSEFKDRKEIAKYCEEIVGKNLK